MDDLGTFIAVQKTGCTTETVIAKTTDKLRCFKALSGFKADLKIKLAESAG